MCVYVIQNTDFKDMVKKVKQDATLSIRIPTIILQGIKKKASLTNRGVSSVVNEDLWRLYAPNDSKR